ncbi:hypothetical protein BBOV_III003710 [Babesia bovis T2Bo]|uniref:Uncharacterized protein n=1 Tax=Babesia bovis TaxID=5865 RepID=A7AN01_BABBO|nr:hypothetical protein BBOV_III003710 [Babesia bovis T2Bo]EDO07935.1 hypothetical protein BBOV_III003710 [Babesia bovis T2Bo]|eukprot:XP_001611503.1 hypothetical protein [Babesia bovis T2Bo]
MATYRNVRRLTGLIWVCLAVLCQLHANFTSCNKDLDNAAQKSELSASNNLSTPGELLTLKVLIQRGERRYNYILKQCDKIKSRKLSDDQKPDIKDQCDILSQFYDDLVTKLYKDLEKAGVLVEDDNINTYDVVYDIDNIWDHMRDSGIILDKDTVNRLIHDYDEFSDGCHDLLVRIIRLAQHYKGQFRITYPEYDISPIRGNSKGPESREPVKPITDEKESEPSQEVDGPTEAIQTPTTANPIAEATSDVPSPVEINESIPESEDEPASPIVVEPVDEISSGNVIVHEPTEQAVVSIPEEVPATDSNVPEIAAENDVHLPLETDGNQDVTVSEVLPNEQASDISGNGVRESLTYNIGGNTVVNTDESAPSHRDKQIHIVFDESESANTISGTINNTYGHPGDMNNLQRGCGRIVRGGMSSGNLGSKPSNGCENDSRNNSSGAYAISFAATVMVSITQVLVCL